MRSLGVSRQEGWTIWLAVVSAEGRGVGTKWGM